MPWRSRAQDREKRLQNTLNSHNSVYWECPRCTELILTLRGGRLRHEKKCRSLSEADRQYTTPVPTIFPNVIPTRRVVQRAESHSNDTPIRQRQRFAWRSLASLEQRQGTLNERTGPSSSHRSLHGPLESTPTLQSVEWDDWSEVPNQLAEDEEWIRKHPTLLFQNRSPDFPNPSHAQPPSLATTSSLPPFYPFASVHDFEQAELFILRGASDSEITAQLKLNAQRLGTSGQSLKGMPQNAAQLHEILDFAAREAECKFQSQDIITPEFKGKTFKYTVRFRSLWNVACDMVKDPDLKDYFIYTPEQRFVCSTLSGKVVQAIEEPYHSRGWWNAQLRLGPNRYIVYIQLYIDATHLTLAGGAKVWPVYLWLGNLPSSLRKKDGKGGAVLVGYLPLVKEEKDLSPSKLAELRVYVYHASLKCIIQSIENICAFGKLVKCSDGFIRRLFPLIGSISADYEELMKILALLGHQSGYPCPICLVPREEQGDLSGTSWEFRTYDGAQGVLKRAMLAGKPAEAKAIRQEQSLRETVSSLLEFMGSKYSVYEAVAGVDPLHQLELGVFGRHMWPKLTSLLNREQSATLDRRFTNIPPYPDLNHFTNSVTSLQHIEGNEYGTILQMLAPLIEDLLPTRHMEIILSTLRTLACIHLLSKFTTHTEETLDMLQDEITKFGSQWERFSSRFQARETESDIVVSAKFPKLHSLVHYVDIIRSKGTSNNYETSLGERQHPQSKTDYNITNHQPGYENQMLRTYRERETIARIAANIQRHKSQSASSVSNNLEAHDSSPRVTFGSPQPRKLTSTFISNLPYPQSAFQKQLQMFLYENVLGHQARRMPSVRHLPSLQGTHVVPYRLLRVLYVSLLDSREGLDLVRSSPEWRGGDERRDFIMLYILTIMGAAISELKNQISGIDDAKGKEEEVKEALENMRLMASDQLEAFNERIRNRDADTHLIPIKKILSSFQYIQCTTSSSDNIGPGIQDAVKDFSTGPVADGIANLAASVIGKLLGESSGSRQLQTRYVISIDPLGGISRLDAFFFVYNFSSSGLMKTAKSVVAACVVKSSADVEDIDDNTLRVLVNQCFETSSLELRRAIYGELCDAIFNSKDPSYKASLLKARESQRAALEAFAIPRRITHAPEQEAQA